MGASVVRRVVAALVVAVAAVGLLAVLTATGDPRLRIIRLTQFCAFSALILLYFTLLISPFAFTFKRFPGRRVLFYARRALGLGALFFSAAHGTIAFFGQLQGFEGFTVLPDSYVFPVWCGLTALFVLTVLGSTAWDGAVKRLGFRRWKLVHRFVYLAGVLVLLHAALLGTHFSDPRGATAVVFGIALLFLAVLQGRRLDAWMGRRLSGYRHSGIPGVLLTVIFCSGAYIGLLISGGEGPVANVHTRHQQADAGEIAADGPNPFGSAGPGAEPTNSASEIGAGYAGDGLRRVGLSVSPVRGLEAGRSERVELTVFDEDTGSAVFVFTKYHEQDMHLIVVDESLGFFRHLYPVLTDERRFVADIVFPRSGRYRMYMQFQALGAALKTTAVSVTAGPPAGAAAPGQDNGLGSNAFPKSLAAEAGWYHVAEERLSIEPRTLDDPPAEYVDFALGKWELHLYRTQADGLGVRVIDTTDPESKIGFAPFQGAPGHAVMIHQESLRAYHLHGVEQLSFAGGLVFFDPDSASGRPLPGPYRVFVEAAPEGQNVVADFSILW